MINTPFITEDKPASVLPWTPVTFLVKLKSSSYSLIYQVMNTVVLTGDRPTGPLHLGHYVGSLMNRLALQKEHHLYMLIADVQALTDHMESPQTVVNHIDAVLADYLAVGLDPERCTFYLQSQIPEIAELTIYFMNLVTLARLERNPTVKHEMQQKGMESQVPVGFLCYPISQAADIATFRANRIPVGEDQIPILEQTNEILRKFNRLYGNDFFPEVSPILSACPRLVGIHGQEKASKSRGNAIFLSDTSETLKAKIWSMYTDPDHLKIQDPGKVEGHVVFSYLSIFHPDQLLIDDLKAHYRRGGLGDTTLKELLYNTLEALLGPIREGRNQYTAAERQTILQAGTQKARFKASETLQQVRSLMGLPNFS